MNNIKKRAVVKKSAVRKRIEIKEEIIETSPYFKRPMYDPTPKEIDFLSHELIEWGKLETSLRADDFALDKTISRAQFHRWREKWPQLQQAYEIVCHQIGRRREMGAMTGKFNPAFVLASMPMHDPKWKKMYEWKASLNKKEQDKPTTIIVQVPDIASSKVVPEKDEK